MSAALVISLLVSQPSLDEARAIAQKTDERIGQLEVDLDRATQGATVGLGGLGNETTFERRLADAEVHMMLEDHWRAAVLLLDAVERPGHRSHPRYDDAVFLLGEAFRLSRNYASAKRYLQELLPRVKGERLMDVVAGLLAIASETRDHSGVDQALSRLRSAGGLTGPEVNYLFGRTAFAQGKLEAALRSFRSVPPTADQGVRASYYAGVTLVRLENFPAAVTQFESTIALADRASTLRDLAHLSVGRLRHELGQTEQSALAYAEIKEESPYFQEMLFEVAWVHVKEANQATTEQARRAALEDALQATELLMATAPPETLDPKARLLQGNLQIRLGAPETAYEAFEGVVTKFAASSAELEAFVVSREDTQAFFDKIVERDLDGRGALAAGLPELAVTWVLDEDRMGRVLVLERDLAESGATLEENRELVSMLTSALQGEGRFRMFTALGPLRDQMISIHNRWLAAELALVQSEMAQLRPTLQPSEAQRAEAAFDEVERLAQQIKALPLDSFAVQGVRGRIGAAYDEASLRAYKLTYRISTMRAELSAVRAWLNESRSDLSAKEAELVQLRLRKTEIKVVGLEQRLERLLAALRQAATVAESDSGISMARRLARSFLEARERTLSALQAGRSRSSTELVGILSRYDQQRRSLAGARQRLEALESRIQARVDGRVASIRRELSIESARLEEEAARFAVLERSSDDVLDPVRRQTLVSVQDKFDELVLEADVGLIDVAWARKQSETSKVTGLIKEMQERTASLEEEFADVLEP